MKAAVNVIGPDGQLVIAGNDIPDDWPDDFRQSLVATGGAVGVDVVPGTPDPPPPPPLAPASPVPETPETPPVEQPAKRRRGAKASDSQEA